MAQNTTWQGQVIVQEYRYPFATLYKTAVRQVSRSQN